MKKPMDTLTNESYIRPARANNLMRAAQNNRQTVYIYGATGYGKTSFVLDFLARKAYEYYSMAEDTLLSEAEKHTGELRTVVVDDLQLLCTMEERKNQYDILERLMQDANVWLILISRAPIPAWLKPLYIQNVFLTIGEADLALSEKEEDAYLSSWQLVLVPKSADFLKAYASGYPLYLKILAMKLQSISDDQSNEQRQQAEMLAMQEAQKDLWEYLSMKVYDDWDLDLQEFLMNISIVESFDLQLAHQITKKSNVKQLVQDAQEIGNFLTERTENAQTVYELRPALRLSMKRRLEKRYSKAYIEELYHSAGNEYELEGRISEALSMYEQCGNEESISRLLTTNARKHAGSGAYWELRRYYLALSEETICQSAELMAGMSLLQSIMMNDEESERWYQTLEAYMQAQTGNARKAAQARLFYLDIALPQRGTAHMTDILKKAWMFITEKRTILPELSLTNNQPSMMHGGKDFCEWSKRDRELAKTIGKPVEILMGRFGKGLVNLALAESFFEKGEPDSYEVQTLIQKGWMQALSGGKLEQVFVAVGLWTWMSVLNNHMEDALDSLESFRKKAAVEAPHLLTGIDTLRIRFLLYRGDAVAITDWMAQAPDEDAEFCTLERSRYITKARVYLATGKREKALSLLQKILLYAKKRQRTYLQIEAEILLGITQFRLGMKQGSETMQTAITQAESYHFVRILSREGAALWTILKTHTFNWQDTEFQKQTMQECRQTAQFYPAYLSEKTNDSMQLSDKALSILRLQAQGKSTEEIAKLLLLSKSGVKYYNQETYKKLGVNNKAAAVNEARNRKLL